MRRSLAPPSVRSPSPSPERTDLHISESDPTSGKGRETSIIASLSLGSCNPSLLQGEAKNLLHNKRLLVSSSYIRTQSDRLALSGRQSRGYASRSNRALINICKGRPDELGLYMTHDPMGMYTYENYIPTEYASRQFELQTRKHRQLGNSWHSFRAVKSRESKRPCQGD